MITRIHPIVVFVKDFGKSLAFYRDKVGLKLAYPPSHEHGGGWAEFKVGGSSFCIHGGGRRTNRNSSVDVHFEVKGIQATVRRMKARGVRFLCPVTKMPYGVWETTFRDPSGNTFELVEPLPKRR